MTFAAEFNMLQEPVSKVIPLFDKEIEEKFKELEANCIITSESPEIYY